MSANQFEKIDGILEYLGKRELEVDDITVENAILRAVQVCDLELEYGLENGGDRTSAKGVTFFGAIARMIRILIDAGRSDINAANEFGQTSLFIAIMNNLDEIASILISSGCDVNRQDEDGESALHVSALKENEYLTRLLIASGADTSLKNQSEKKPICFAARNERVLKAFIDAGANINTVCNAIGQTPLHMAARYENSNSVDLLLRSGAQIDSLDYNGATPLMFAASFPQNLSVVSALIVAGASIDIVDNFGNTALHWIFCPEILGILVAVGADVNKTNFDNQSPLQRVLLRPLPKCQMQTVTSILFAAGAEFNSVLRSNLAQGDSNWHAVFDNPAPFVEKWQQRFVYARRQFSIRIFREIRHRAFLICCALQSLQLPALLTMAILDAYFEPIHGSYHLVTMYTKWTLVTVIKHKT